MCRWCKTLNDAKQIATEWRKKLRHCSLILKTHQTFHSQSQSVKMMFVFQDQSGILVWFVMTSFPWNKLVKRVSLPSWLRRISSVRHVLTVDATKTLRTSLVLSRLDYCNSLLSGIPQQLIDKLQNCSARLIFKMAKLHWLPIAQRIDNKISSLCHDVSDTAPLYLSDLLRHYVPSPSLRSSADTRIFRIPKRKKFQGLRDFSHPGPVTGNKLPYSVLKSTN